MHFKKTDNGRALHTLYERLNKDKAKGIDSGELASFIRGADGVGFIGTMGAGEMADAVLAAADDDGSLDVSESEFEAYVARVLEDGTTSLRAPVRLDRDHPSSLLKGWLHLADKDGRDGVSSQELGDFLDRYLEVGELNLPGFAAGFARSTIVDIAAAIAMQVLDPTGDATISQEESSEACNAIDWVFRGQSS